MDASESTCTKSLPETLGAGLETLGAGLVESASFLLQKFWSYCTVVFLGFGSLFEGDSADVRCKTVRVQIFGTLFIPFWTADVRILWMMDSYLLSLCLHICFLVPHL